MTVENGIIDATYHPDARYMRYRTGNPIRGRTLPHDSIFYRPTDDVPPVPASDDILDWCMENWERPYINVAGGSSGWEAHDAAAASPTNSNLRQPSYYLDEAPVVPKVRTIELSSAYSKYLSTTPSRDSGLVRVTDGYFPGRLERRVMGGHARSQWNFLNGSTRPFHPVDGDRSQFTIWPSLQMTTETIECDWVTIDANRDSRVLNYTQRSFNSNDWPVYWNNTKPDNRGAYAGASSSAMPIPSLLVTYDELARGWINHTIMMIVQSYSGGGPPEGQPGIAHWPGIRSDGIDEFAPGALEAGGPFGGHVFRLKRSFDIRGFTDNPFKRTLLRGLRDYGMILLDRHGSSYSGGLRPQGQNRPVNVSCAEHPLFGDYLEFGGGVRGTNQPADYTPGAMAPLVLEPGALPMSKEYWEVLSLRNYQKIIPGRPRASTYPAFDEYGNPIVNQDHWQCIMPDAA